MTDVYVLTLFSANTSTTAKTVSTEFNEWTVQIPPDPSAPILDGRWKAHVLFASIKGFVPKGTRTVIGILSDAVCHLDTIDQFTSSAIPNLADWTIVLRFEMLGRKTRATLTESEAFKLQGIPTTRLGALMREVSINKILKAVGNSVSPKVVAIVAACLLG
eukprot:jgi/Mesvir1/29365/Mv02545-RA.1